MRIVCLPLCIVMLLCCEGSIFGVKWAAVRGGQVRRVNWKSRRAMARAPIKSSSSLGYPTPFYLSLQLHQAARDTKLTCHAPAACSGIPEVSHTTVQQGPYSSLSHDCCPTSSGHVPLTTHHIAYPT
jgi:hypothetical protein